MPGRLTGVLCGHVETPLDAYTFAQINDGNAIALPFALGFGWGGDLNLQYTSRSFSASLQAADIPRREQFRSRGTRRSSTR